jgi:hypothetical protein
MKVDKGHYSFLLNSAKSVLALQGLLIATCTLLITFLPQLLLYKVLPLLAVAVVAVKTIVQYSACRPTTLVYRTVDDQWLLNGTAVALQSEQFITRSLVIVYLVTDKGKKHSLWVPADAMARDQHRCLRKLLIMRIQLSRGAQSHPDRQN